MKQKASENSQILQQKVKHVFYVISTNNEVKFLDVIINPFNLFSTFEKNRRHQIMRKGAISKLIERYENRNVIMLREGPSIAQRWR